MQKGFNAAPEIFGILRAESLNFYHTNWWYPYDTKAKRKINNLHLFGAITGNEKGGNVILTIETPKDCKINKK